MTDTGTTRYLPRPEGRIAYDVRGEGPLVVAVPSMGDTRAEYRFLAERLVAAGYRVATMDLRGHGESDTTFPSTTRVDAGRDLLALVEELRDDREPGAHLVGCSVGAGAAVWAAAEAPQQIASITLVGPFVRQVPTPAPMRLVQTLGLRLLLARPWGPRAWAWWYGKLYPGSPPSDLAEHRAALARNLAEPGRLEAVRAVGSSSIAEVEARLSQVRAPALVVMGTADPDFPDPAAEARWIADRLHAETLLVEGAGHYPHVEAAETTAETVLGFLAGAAAGV